MSFPRCHVVPSIIYLLIDIYLFLSLLFLSYGLCNDLIWCNIMVLVLGKGWCVDLSVMARILLLAAYLASRNSQDTDRTTFGNALKGRRKKARMGSEETSSSNQDIYDRHSVPRAFGLERLVAIYIQILPAAGIARRLIHGRQEVSGTSAGVDKDLTDNESLIYATVSVFSVSSAQCAVSVWYAELLLPNLPLRMAA